MLRRTRVPWEFLVLLAVWVAWAANAGAVGQKPWALRDHYSYDVGNCVLDYAQDNGEWRVRVKGVEEDLGVLADRVGFSVVLEDGRAMNNATLEEPEHVRSAVDTRYGRGTRYRLTFPAQDGVQIVHAALTFVERPFTLMSVTIKNVGDTPVSLEKIGVAVVGPGGIKNFGERPRNAVRALSFRSGWPVFDKTSSPCMTLFQDPVRGVSVALGVLPGGHAETGSDFQSSGGAWQGEVFCRYAPARVIAPGQAVESDPVCILFGLDGPSDVDLFYSWACSTLPRPKVDASKQGKGPRVWVSVAEDASFASLVRRAKAWQDSGVTHVLVPASWEGRPGSLRGAVPRYPKDMAQAARALRDLGLVPGITLDPLPVQGGKEQWTAQSVDGQTWLNLAAAGAQPFAAGRIQKILGWGFRFIAVAPSAIPDAVLGEFGMTRAQADHLAMVSVAAAAPGVPVFPAATTVLAAERDAWLDAASAIGRLAEFGAVPAPVRLNTSGLSQVDAELSGALRLWGGAVELLGQPKAGIRAHLVRILSGPRLTARALDGGQRAPLLWQICFSEAESGYLGGAVVAFLGAEAWNQDDLVADSEGPVIVWRGSNGDFVDAQNRAVPAAQGLEVHGLTPDLNRPTFMGASGGLALHLDQLRGLTWNERDGVLRGRIAGPAEPGAVAHVAVPEPWVFKGGTVGSKRLRHTAPARRLSFQIGGADTAFELEFQRN